MSRVTADLSAENTFTNALSTVIGAHWLQISGTFSGTLTLQCSVDGGTTWATVNTFTAPGRWEINEPGHIPTGSVVKSLNPDPQYRVGFVTGNYGSGTATCTIGRN